jgi:acetolactate synthase-1/2/3 large subunit
VLKEDLYKFLLYTLVNKNPYVAPQKWIDEINNKKEESPDVNELMLCEGINPNYFIDILSTVSGNASAFIADVGSNQMWSAQSIKLKQNQLFLTSGGMGAMGYALPAAIGASIALNNSPVVCICGDGGFQLNIQELETIGNLGLPIKIVVLDNGSLGMVRQFQDDYFESRHQSTVWGYSTPPIVDVAKAYGIDSINVNYNYEIKAGLNFLWKELGRPCLVRIEINRNTNVYPKIAWGKSLTEMHP